MKISKLNSQRLGEILLGTPLKSHQANHNKIQSTMEASITSSEEHLEGKFVHDVFTKNTQDIIDEWYDGDERAAKLLEMIQEDRPSNQ
ncbi:hypothetical protein GLW08_06010 [Pontibacillus yanchengensis]|uniref:Uncharacterized protein n=2 Tax=Pontibacillus yanchengensis TaxID=462910 RepID=A0ACC7VE65_9BACI|nr:hypothetical protein [Pontibacillus yanchengensis]MYL32310.1 hypothetical protein [Pontibacillus yanchengensis]MYL52890.1 hypothetical protein [Pontibacillus yanchengensis]